MRQVTLAEVYSRKLRLKSGAVVVADACETGLIEVGRGVEEYNRLPGGLSGGGRRDRCR